jgi:hypothetical protein
VWDRGKRTREQDKIYSTVQDISISLSIRE